MLKLRMADVLQRSAMVMNQRTMRDAFAPRVELRSSASQRPAAFGALHLLARLSRGVSHLFSALGADTKAARPRGGRSAHSSCSSCTLASHSRPPAASASGACSQSSWHDVFSFPTAPSLAAGHGERSISERAVQISGQHIIDRSTEERAHAHTGSRDLALQWSGDRSTDQRIRAAVQQLLCPGRPLRPDEALFLPASFTVALHVDQQKILGDVEDGSDAALPLWNCDPHREGRLHPGDQTASAPKRSGCREIRLNRCCTMQRL